MPDTRADLLGLLEAAGLADSPVRHQVEAEPGKSLLVGRRDGVLQMMRMAAERGNAPTLYKATRQLDPERARRAVNA